jgi:integrase
MATSGSANGRSSIYQSPTDGRWHGYVSMGADSTGKPDRRHVRGKTQADVTRKVRELEKLRDRGTPGAPGRMPTVKAYLEQWLTSCERTRRPSTVRGYSTYVKEYAIPRLGGHRLDRLRPEHIEMLYRWMAERGLSPATVASMHRTFRSALNRAVKRHLIVVNPMSGLDAPTAEVSEVEPLTAEDARKVLNAATSDGARNGARWIVALSLGLRQGEALGLQWQDVDLNAGTLTVRRALSRGTWKHGCRDPEDCTGSARTCPRRFGGGLVTGEPKSRAGRRTVVLPPTLLEALKTHKKAQAAERLKAGEMWRDEGWLFATEVGGPMDPRVDRGAWKALLTRAGVRDARLHDARHTAATLLLVQGIDTRTVMTLMGWSQISMTTRYQHVVPELKRAAADQMESALWGS